MKMKIKLTVAASMLLTLVLAACGGATGPEAAAPDATATMAATAIPTPANPTQALIDAMLKLQETYPFRQHLEGAVPGCGEMKGTSDFAALDEFHLTISACLMSYEAITKDGRWFYKTGGGWQETPPLVDASQIVPDVNKMMREGLKSVTFAGFEALDGAPMLMYDYVAQPADSPEMTGRVWVGALDGLPYKMTSSFSYEGQPVSLTTTYEFDVPITIEAPVP